MKAKFLKSTNRYLYEKYKDLIGDLWISEGMAFIGKNKNYENGFRTSLIDTVSCEDTILTIKTLNSVYVFEIVEGSIKDLDTFEKLKTINNKKSKFFVCQVGGSPLIDNAISIAELPEIMSLNEAKEYLKNNILLDVSGEIVINIGAPYFPEE
jgi:hypothetical protein